MRNRVVAALMLLIAVAGIVAPRAARAQDEKPREICRGTLVVHALTGEGAPIAGAVAEAWLVPAPTEETWGISPDEPTLFVYAATDAAGVAKIPVEEPAVWRVSVRAPGRATESRTVRVGLGVVRDETFHLAAGFALEGTALDQQGKGTGGVTVYAGRVGWEGDLAHFLTKATTDAAGRYRLDGLAKGDVDVFARRGGPSLRWQARLSVPGNARLDFSFPRGGRMTGVVRDVENGGIVPGARVRAYEFGGACIGDCVADASGVYVLDATAARVEIHRLIVDAPGRVLVTDDPDAPPQRSVVLATDGTFDCDLKVRRTARIIGTVTGDGKPVAGADVALHSKSREFAADWILHRATTDAAGAYAFDGIDAGDAFVRVTAPGWRHPGFPAGGGRSESELAEKAPKSARGRVPATGAVQIDVALERFAGRTITGRVIDDTETPVAGVDVLCGEATASSAVDGTFRLDGVELPEPGSGGAGDTSVRVEARAPDVDDKATLCTFGEKPAVDSFVIVVRGRPRLRVRVLGDDGTTVPGATATFDEKPGTEMGGIHQWPPAPCPVCATTGPDGYAVLVPGGSDFDDTVTVRAPGFATSRAAIQLAAGARDATVDVKLLKGRDVVVKVVDGSTNEPVAGAWLTLGPDEDAGPPDISALPLPDQRSEVYVGRTGADGTFLLRDVGPEAIRVQALAPGHYISEARITPKSAEAVVVLGAHLSIRGRIEFEDGRPARFASYSTHWVDAPEGWPCWFDLKDAGADGAFSVDGLRPGTYEIEVIAYHEEGREDAAPCLVGPLKAGASGVIVRLQKARRIEGTVVGSDGKGRAGLSIEISPRPGSRMAAAPPVATGDGGRFSAPGVARGPVHVRIVDWTGEDGRGRRVDVFGPFDPKDGEPIRIVREDGLAISGKLVDAAGAPVADAPIAAVPADAKDPDLFEPDRGCFTDAEGRFRIAGLTPGAYRLWQTVHDWRAAGESYSGPGRSPVALDPDAGTPAGTSGLVLTRK